MENDNDVTVSAETSDNGAVEITAEIPAENEPGETPVVVVVEDEADDDAVEAVVMDTTIDQEGRIAALETNMDNVLGILERHDASISTLVSVQETIATATAENAIAVEETAEAVEEVAEEIEPDEPPESTRTHWWFRPASEYRKRK